MTDLSLPGRLINTGTYTAYLEATGDRSPTIVLISGLGTNALVWRLVQPEVAKFTHVVSYDRAGLGSSTPTETPRTPANIAAELYDLLLVAKIPPPYILVGHSMGGVHARAFVRAYADEVAGLVLVDSSHEQQTDRLPPKLLEDDQRIWEARFAPLLAATHEQLQDAYRQQPRGPLPPEVYEADIARIQPSVIATIARERDAYWNNRGALPPASLGDLPLLVLTNVSPSPFATGEFNIGWGAVWQALQDELAALSSRAEHRRVEGSHFLHVDNPIAVVAAIHDLVERVRQQV